MNAEDPKCPKCMRPRNMGNSPNRHECTETDDDEGLCEAYAKIATLRARARDAEIWRDRNYARIGVLEAALRDIGGGTRELWQTIEIARAALAPSEGPKGPTPRSERREGAGCDRCGGSGNIDERLEGHTFRWVPCPACAPPAAPRWVKTMENRVDEPAAPKEEAP